MDLHTLAYKAERSASLRLAAQRGCSLDEALRQTLADAAGGAARLPALLAQRRADQEAVKARAQARLERQAAQQARRSALQLGAPTPWRGWFDGSAWPNPGRCGIGAVLTGPGGERIELARAAGHGNSSEAEYLALIALLETAVAHGATVLSIYGDSKVVIDDVCATSPAPALTLAPLRERAQALLAQLPGAVLRWIPRHRNVEADALSQQARTMTAGDHV
ncbi:MAG: ribonuclease HI family protein [Massilia sp.]